jgi:hypothetical protein
LYLDQNAIDDPKEVLKQTDAQKIFEQGVFDI